MNRVAQTLRLVEPPVLWIVVEGNAASFETWEILRKAGVMYRHLVSKRVQYATEVKSLDGTLMRRAKDYAGSMLICLDLLSTALYSGTPKDGDVPFHIQLAS